MSTPSTITQSVGTPTAPLLMSYLNELTAGGDASGDLEWHVSFGPILMGSLFFTITGDPATMALIHHWLTIHTGP